MSVEINHGQGVGVTPLQPEAIALPVMPIEEVSPEAPGLIQEISDTEIDRAVDELIAEIDEALKGHERDLEGRRWMKVIDAKDSPQSASGTLEFV